MWVADNWKDYVLLDASDGERLESWGKYSLVRPDPQVIWKGERKHALWKNADANYRRSRGGGGAWGENRLPEKWTISYGSLRFSIKPMGFKHTGLFPEQATNWDWFSELIKRAGRPIKVLNLFAYTGGATVAAAAAGASVCHVDAAKGMVERAGENVRLSNVGEGKVRYIIDDCKKFVEREIRRGKRYDAIIMDPPSYGRGPNGEMWKLENELYSFVELCSQVLSDNPLFVLINSYTTGLQPQVLKNILALTIANERGGNIDAYEVGLKTEEKGVILPCGNSGIWING
jgi:23S rRNA (cytosine1962-C5)-methyltransferase